jgi:DNA-binding MarR family transcriptional regulator
MSTKKQSSPEIAADQLHSAAVHLLRWLRRTDAASGLNAPRLSALSVIVFGGPVTLGNLAEAEQVRPPTMTRIVNALEAQGLVTKKRIESDLRTIHISSTMKGKKVLIAGRNRRIHRLANQIGALDASERETLQSAIALMKKMIPAV